MTTFTRKTRPHPLELTEPFEDLSGLIAGDLRVIVGALTQRAAERRLLSPRQQEQLRRTLWENLSSAITEALEPLEVERQ